jgi:hypothetical protein
MRKIMIMLCAAALLVVGTTAQPEDPIVTPVSGFVLINDSRSIWSVYRAS